MRMQCKRILEQELLLSTSIMLFSWRERDEGEGERKEQTNIAALYTEIHLHCRLFPRKLQPSCKILNQKKSKLRKILNKNDKMISSSQGY